jgi:predicted transcriptional regulator
MPIWRDYLRAIACDRTLRGEDLRVLLLILSYVEDGVQIPLTPKDISKILGKSPDSISRAVRRLVERGAIAKRYEAGKLVGYEIKERF